jgi:hypothetical protein
MSIDDFRMNCSVFECGGAWKLLKSVCDRLKFTTTEWDAGYDDDDDSPDLWFGFYVKPPRKGSRHRAVPHGLKLATGGKYYTFWMGYAGQGDEKARADEVGGAIVSL